MEHAYVNQTHAAHRYLQSMTRRRVDNAGSGAKPSLNAPGERDDPSKQHYRRNQIQFPPLPSQPLSPELLKVNTEETTHPAQPSNAPVGLPTKHAQYVRSTSGGPIQVCSMGMYMTSSPPLPMTMTCPPGPQPPLGIDQRLYLQTNQPAATGDMSAYQLHIPDSSLPQGVVMAHIHGPQKPPEEVTRKRELRLMKNREAARECRRKKKEYVKCLENRVAVLENQNKTLIEELRALKDIYRHKAEQASKDCRERKKAYVINLEAEVGVQAANNKVLAAENKVLAAENKVLADKLQYLQRTYGLQ